MRRSTIIHYGFTPSVRRLGRRIQAKCHITWQLTGSAFLQSQPIPYVMIWVTLPVSLYLLVKANRYLLTISRPPSCRGYIRKTSALAIRILVLANQPIGSKMSVLTANQVARVAERPS